MEFFWGVEVKPGQTVSCDPEKGCILRISQAALGETKKGSHNIVVSAKVDDQKVIIGTLSAENRPQFVCDLIFHKEFELSHSSKTASVFVCGYRAVMPDQPEYGSSKDEGEVKTVHNQVINPIAAADDSDSSSSDDLTSSGDDMTEDESSSEDDSSEEDDSSSEEDDSSSEEDDSSSEEVDSSSEELDSSSEEDSSDEEDKNTLRPEDGKRRVAETALKTPASGKKAKIATPSGQTTGDKVPHVATPHPAKQASKASGNNSSKSKAKSPKSVGTHVCKSCSRTFVCDSALQSHEKAKHA